MKNIILVVLLSSFAGSCLADAITNLSSFTVNVGGVSVDTNLQRRAFVFLKMVENNDVPNGLDIKFSEYMISQLRPRIKIRAKDSMIRDYGTMQGAVRIILGDACYDQINNYYIKKLDSRDENVRIAAIEVLVKALCDGRLRGKLRNQYAKFLSNSSSLERFAIAEGLALLGDGAGVDVLEQTLASNASQDSDKIRAYEALLALDRLDKILHSGILKNATGNVAYDLLWKLPQSEWENPEVCKIACNRVCEIAHGRQNKVDDMILRLIAFNLCRDKGLVIRAIGPDDAKRIERAVWLLLEDGREEHNVAAANLAFLVVCDENIPRIMERLDKIENDYAKSVLISTSRNGCEAARLRPYLKNLQKYLKSQSYPLKIAVLAAMESCYGKSCYGKEFVMPKSDSEYESRLKVAIENLK